MKSDKSRINMGYTTYSMYWKYVHTNIILLQLYYYKLQYIDMSVNLLPTE